MSGSRGKKGGPDTTPPPVLNNHKNIGFLLFYTATNVASISFAWPSSLEPQHSPFTFPVVLSNNLLYDLSLSLSLCQTREFHQKSQSHIWHCYYTHPDHRALDSCQSYLTGNIVALYGWRLESKRACRRE